jgi:SpoVK/Ycf46/Vps4 family AAA+-type ATPase
MTNTRKLADLFRAIGEADLPRARALAVALSKEEVKNGHASAARLLRGALNGTRSTLPEIPELNIPEPDAQVSVVSTALVRLRGETSLSGVYLDPGVRKELNSLVAEWRGRAKLAAYEVAPRSKVLFHGPPGCGKSLTARALGAELGLPVYMVRFDAVIGAFLGQTAMHLREIFRFAERVPCVLLLDELDALGKRRGNPLDVGELDRIVISLMQELEHSRPNGLIIATSNLASHLDDALWRRFDLDLHFKTPGRRALDKFVKDVARARQLRLTAAVLKRALRAKTYAGAEAVVVDEIRRRILSKKEAE